MTVLCCLWRWRVSSKIFVLLFNSATEVMISCYILRILSRWCNLQAYDSCYERPFALGLEWQRRWNCSKRECMHFLVLWMENAFSKFIEGFANRTVSSLNTIRFEEGCKEEIQIINIINILKWIKWFSVYYRPFYSELDSKEFYIFYVLAIVKILATRVLRCVTTEIYKK